MTTQRIRSASVAILVGCALLAPVSAAADEPDQVLADRAQLAYEINRARWDPMGFQERVGGSFLPANLLPAPPLAPNSALIDSSSFKANEMADAGYFGHRSEVTGMWPNELVRVHGYDLPSFLSDESNNVESLYAGSSDPVLALHALARSSSHRNHIFGVGSFFDLHVELGVGRSTNHNFWAVHTAYSDRSARFVTGAVFDDADSDGFLSKGEGVAGVVVRIGESETTTDDAGTYTMRVAAGTHRVVFTGTGISEVVDAAIHVGSYNIWVDYALGEPDPVIRAYELCAGMPPTILGTSGDDELRATAGRDVINGLGGDDIVVGLGPDDIVCNVVIEGGAEAGGPAVVDRLAGSNRYSTAATVARSANPGTSEVVYLATGENFPDALAAGPAAASQQAPILLVTTTSVPAVTARELQRLSPVRVVILGGPSAVAPSVEHAVAELLPTATVIRLAGSTRYDTAVDISRASFDPGVPVVFVASGLDFPDALVGAPAAVASAGPMLLVKQDSIPSAVTRELRRLRPGRIVIVGDVHSVSPGVQIDLGELAGSVERITGTTWSATSVEVSRKVFPAGSSVVYVAVGTNFPDALTGGAAIHAGLGPILLVGRDSVGEQVLAEVRRLDPVRIVILGGPGAVSGDVERRLRDIIG